MIKLCKYPPLSVAGWRACPAYSHRARLARDVHNPVAVTRLSFSPYTLLFSREHIITSIKRSRRVTALQIMDSGSLSPLLVLPNELQLAVIEYLRQPRDVLHLGRTCKALHAITTSDDVWRARVESLVRHQMRTSHSNPASLTSWQAGTSDIYKTFVDRLLGKGAKYLGGLSYCRAG